jgi:hypothetical protein
VSQTPEPSQTAQITVACLDMAGTTVADDGSVIAAFSAAVEQFGLPEGTPDYDEAPGRGSGERTGRGR